MKIFNTITTTLFTITLLMMCSTGFGMGKGDDVKKTKKVFGPATLIVPAVPEDVEQWRNEKRQKNKQNDNQQNDAHLAALCLASVTDHTGDVQDDISKASVLLEQGANPNLSAADSAITPLHLAITNPKKAPLVKLLLDWKANANAADSQQTTPLHSAAMHNNNYAVRYLIKAGAQETPNNQGSLPRYYATYAKSKLVAPLFWSLHIAENSPSVQQYTAHRTALLPIIKKFLHIPAVLQDMVVEYIPETLYSPDDLTTLMPENRECLFTQAFPSAPSDMRSIDENKNAKN